MTFSDFAIPAATLLSGLAASAGVLIISKTRKPVETTDLWGRLDKLQEANDLLREEFSDYRDNKDQEFMDYKKDMAVKLEARDKERRAFHHFVAVISDALDAAWSYVKVLQATMNDAGITAPEPSAYVKMATDAARQVRTANTLMEES